MISPLKFSSNVNFKGSTGHTGAFNNFKSYENYQKEASKKTDEQKIAKIEQDVDKNTQDIKQVQNKLKEKKPGLFTRAKGKVLRFFKGINNITYVSKGMSKGIAQGITGFYAVSFLGKNIKSAIKEKSPLTFVTGACSDICKLAGKVGRNVEKIPSVFAEIFAKQPDVTQGKAILNTTGKILSAIAKGCKNIGSSTAGYLKGNKLVAGIAVVAGIALAAKSIIQAKIKANLENSNLDHKYNYGHNK